MLGRKRAMAAALVVTAGFAIPAVHAGAVTARAGSGKAQSAASLFTADSLGTAVASPVVSTTDEGAAASGTGSFDSQATATTASGALLTFVVSTFPNAKIAKQAYQNQSQSLSGATPLSGVGDAAVTDANDTYVLKGAQVLTVGVKPTVEKETELDQVKARGGDPEAGFQALGATGATAAKAAAAKLTGTGSTSTAYVPPPGGVNPCVLSGATVAKLYKAPSATATAVLSESPPATECRYSISGVGAEDLFITSSDQLYTPSYPTDIYAEFERIGGTVQYGGSTTPTTTATNSAYRAVLVGAVHREFVGSGQSFDAQAFAAAARCESQRLVQAQDDGSLEISTDEAGKVRLRLVEEAAKTPSKSFDPQEFADALKLQTQANDALQSARGAVNDALDQIGAGTPTKSQVQDLNTKLDNLKKAATDACKAGT